MKKRLLPLAVLLGGFAFAIAMIATGPTVQPKPSRAVAPLVRVVAAIPTTVQLRTYTHGTVVPRTESELVPEVDGRVIEISPSLVSGGFFAKGDVLMRIEPVDYAVALEQARAGLARAKSDLSNARTSHKRQQDLVSRGATSDAQRDDALNRVRIAEATLREATARLSRAKRDLERTAMVAPYDGRVRSERVDVGQFVKRGTPVGTIYAVDFAEVRLPIHDEELAFLDLPLASAGAAGATPIPVTLRARFAGTNHEWQGEVVRTEGELDPTTRMVNVVARIPEPYVKSGDRPPLSVGLFVDAEIEGETLPNLVVLPRSAMRGDSQVLVVDDENRLRFRDVDVFRRADETVYIRAGLERDELVCISPLQSTADGMLVRLANEPKTSLAGSASGEFGS
ncbi:MAG: efflux RND transporter periplasmic adaptor subunit [Gammaproteobacteria bacterium]|nr:efflux RND transporter periplasmic adaptor subunit [Gammaproteobacteria bacterium]